MFDNKAFLITGASSGLGQALAIKLANKNAKMALMARRLAGLEETASHCTPRPLLISGDITSESDCRTAIDHTIEQFGRLDYLVLNAGISMWSHFEELSDLSAIHQLMQTNYIGAVNCAYYALPHLKKTNGMIVVISSIQGKIGVPYHTGYAASKHALEGFFNSLRIELNKTVDILIASPGWIQGTELKQHALGRQQRNHTPAKHAIPLETCCDEIISAMIQRKRECVIPKKYRWVPWLKWLAPALLDDLICKKMR